MSSNAAAQRFNMVESQVRANDVTDVRVQDALREVPRERFVPAAKRAVAYADEALELVPGRFLLEPRVYAKLLQLAEKSSQATPRSMSVVRRDIRRRFWRGSRPR